MGEDLLARAARHHEPGVHHDVGRQLLESLQVVSQGGLDEVALLHAGSDSQGIRLHQMPIEDLYIPGYGYIDITVTFSPPIVLAGGTMSFVGQTFTTSGNAKACLPYYGPIELPYSASFRFDGFETVSVPAATFRAVKLSGSYTVAGQTIGDTLYLAQDLGDAKRINEYEKTFTWELQSTTAGFVRLLTPAGGEAWESGEIHDITWEASEDAARFSLMYSYQLS